MIDTASPARGKRPFALRYRRAFAGLAASALTLHAAAATLTLGLKDTAQCATTSLSAPRNLDVYLSNNC